MVATPSGPVVVAHALGRYPVYVEPGVLGRLESLVGEHLPGGTGGDDRRRDGARAASERAARARAVDRAGPAVPIRRGSKTREQWARLTDALLADGYGRDSGIVALGGGVAGDLAGFVAATYMRGIPYVQVPTSLLAMLDASVGGKTGVDTPQGKNLIGAFHPPAAVVADPRVLATLARAGLPRRHGRGGEARTHRGRRVFRMDGARERRAPPPGRDRVDAAGPAERRDQGRGGERRTSARRGRRAILNAGHTVAHALEQATGYDIPHGEAVALGLVAECALAEGLGVAPAGMGARVAALLRRLGLPVRLAQAIDPDRLMDAMATDKKNRSGRVRFALPRELGAMDSAEGWTREAPDPAIRTAMEAIA